MALPRSVKVKRALLVSLVAKFLAEASCVRADANCDDGRGNDREVDGVAFGVLVD